jgi:hypothetical protein
MCVLPAAHLEMHDTIQQDRVGEQSVFADFVYSKRCLFLLLATSFFSSCMGLPMSSTLWPAYRQSCQGAKISAEKHKMGQKIF